MQQEPDAGEQLVALCEELKLVLSPAAKRMARTRKWDIFRLLAVMSLSCIPILPIIGTPAFYQPAPTWLMVYVMLVFGIGMPATGAYLVRAQAALASICSTEHDDLCTLLQKYEQSIAELPIARLSGRQAVFVVNTLLYYSAHTLTIVLTEKSTHALSGGRKSKRRTIINSFLPDWRLLRIVSLLLTSGETELHLGVNMPLLEETMALTAHTQNLCYHDGEAMTVIPPEHFEAIMLPMVHLFVERHWSRGIRTLRKLYAFAQFTALHESVRDAIKRLRRPIENEELLHLVMEGKREELLRASMGASEESKERLVHSWQSDREA